MCEQGSKWVVEHHVNNSSIVIADTSPKQAVYIYGCKNSTVQVCMSFPHLQPVRDLVIAATPHSQLRTASPLQHSLAGNLVHAEQQQQHACQYMRCHKQPVCCADAVEFLCR